MLAKSFQIDRYRVGFGIADIFQRVCCRFSPNSLSGGGRSFFSSAVWVTEFEFGAAKDIYDSGRMRMHWLFLPRFEAVLEDAHLIVFQQHLVILGRRFHRVLCVRRCA